MANSKKIMIISGEASGDLHGSNLVREYLRLDPDAKFYGIGSTKMAELGVDILHDSKDLAVIGIFEVLARLRIILKVMSDIKRRLKEDKPDLLILIDYPDFNLRIAAYAKKIGVKVLYYISPQVWAWRQGRVKKMAKMIDKMAVIFPFEEEYYLKENMDVTYVGHPLADCVKATVEPEQYRAQLNIPDDAKVITVLPGSRMSEIKLLLSELLGACEALNEMDKSYYFLLSCAPTIEADIIKSAFEQCDIRGQVIEGNIYNAINASDFVITKSGTSTLETAMLTTPMLIVYKVSYLTYLIGKTFIKVDHIGLANIVAGERVVPELIQDNASWLKIADEVSRIMGDKKLYDATRAKLEIVREKLLAKTGASKNTAKLAKEILYK